MTTHPPVSRLVTACLVGGAAGWAMTAAGASATSLAAAYHQDLLWVGLVTAALAASYAGLQLPGGVLVDRLGVRTATAAGLSLVLVAHVAALVAPLPWLAIAARLVSGAGFAVCFVAGAELARTSGRGSWGIGVFGGIALAASGFAVLTVPFAELVVGWRASWLTTGAVSAVAWTLVLRLPRAPVRRPAARHGSGELSMAPGVLRDGELFRLAGMHAVTLGIGLVLSSWATTLLTELWSFGAAAAAVVGSVVLGMSVVSRPLGGHVAARHPGRSRTVWVVALLACALATVALAVPSTPVVAVVAVTVLGIFSGLPFASVVGAAQARQPLRPASALGVMNTVAFGLVVTATPVVGWAVDHGHASTALLAVALLWLVPLAVLPRAPRPQTGAAAA